MRVVVDAHREQRRGTEWSDPVLIGETAVPGTELVAPFYGHGDEVHLAFNFAPLVAPWDAERWRRRIERVAELIEPVGWPSWVLSNHDNVRHRTRYGGSEARARAAAVLLLTLRGTPFLYAGEELGLEDAVVSPERVVDPGGRDGCRAPIPWDATPSHGWASGDPWLPWPPASHERNVEMQCGDSTSILHLYRALLEVRRRSDALAVGSLTLCDAPEGALVYDRRHRADRRRVVIAFDGPLDLPAALVRDWVVEIASSPEGGVGGEPITALAADTAVVLRPAAG
jgi:alpha-glucosidase